MKNKENYTASHIANWFLWRAGEESIEDITLVKLINLICLAYNCNLDAFGEKLFNEKIETHGDSFIIPSIYHEFKSFGKLPINKYSKDVDLETGNKTYPVIEQDDYQTNRVLDVIWSVYKKFDGGFLAVYLQNKYDWTKKLF